MNAVRSPAVSGMFYPGDSKSLEKMIQEFLSESEVDTVPGKVIGIVVPHAGYIYSGKTAAFAYKSASFRSRKVLLIGPNHSSYPYYPAVFSGGTWVTPLGEASVDQREVERIAESSELVLTDNVAHATEHSLEVQVPFLQHITGNDFSFIPVVLGDQSMETVEKLAETLFPLISDYIIIASSDLNHYERKDLTELKDEKIIDSILSLDVNSLYRTIRETGATPCGFGAIAFLMIFTKKLGGKMKLLHHSTSAEASGDDSSVVGYASLVAFIE